MEQRKSRNQQRFFAENQIKLEEGRYQRLLQVIGRIRLNNSADSLEAGRNVVLHWLRSKKKWNVSAEQATSDRPLHLEAEDSTRALWIESAPGFWAVRLDDPCSQVPGRQWRVELVLVDGGSEDAPAFGCTLSVLVPKGGNHILKTPGVPAVIGMMATTQGLQDGGHPLDGSVWEVDRPSELDDLISFIEMKDRAVSVVVISLNRQGASFLGPKDVAKRLAGIAVVASISAEAADDLLLRYSRTLGVFGGAIRMYRVGFNPDIDASIRHPLYLENAWVDRPKLLLSALQFDAMQDSVVIRDHGRDLPGFGEIRRLAADRRLASAIFSAKVEGSFDVESFERDIEQIRKESKEWQALAIEEEMKAKNSDEAQKQTKARLYQYAERIRALEERLSDLQESLIPEFPEDLDGMQEWAETNLAGRLVIAPRAARAASQSEHQEVEKIFESLYLLATSYWRMKVGGGEGKAFFDDAIAALRVRVSPTGTAVDSRKHEDEYSVIWEGRKYKLDMHLAGSDSRDIRRGLRIYFTWDEEQQLVVVGHLPTHLTNEMT